jgi:hypothetical protein
VEPVVEAPAVGPAAHEEQQVQVVPVAQPSAGVAGLGQLLATLLLRPGYRNEFHKAGRDNKKALEH